jgi:hypothetical protein
MAHGTENHDVASHTPTDVMNPLKPKTNQPRKLTKGGVLRKCKVSSLARLNHSCERKVELEIWQR